MTVKVGTATPAAFFAGAAPVSALYAGAVKVWPAGGFVPGPFVPPTFTVTPPPPQSGPLTLKIETGGQPINGLGGMARVLINTGYGEDIQDVQCAADWDGARIAQAIAAAWSNPETTASAAGNVVTVTPKAGITVSALSCVLTEFAGHPADALVFTIATPAPNTEFFLPVNTVANGYDAQIAWGDGFTDRLTAHDGAARKHTYALAGTYDVAITGKFVNVSFFFKAEVKPTAALVRAVKQLGSTQAVSLAAAFKECTNLVKVTTGAGANTSQVTTLNSFVQGCPKLRSVDLSGCDFGKANTLQNFAHSCVELMACTLPAMPAITSISSAFLNCRKLAAPPFDITTLGPMKLTSCVGAFQGDTLLNRLDLSGWDMSAVTGASSLLANQKLDTDIYDKILIAWAAQTVKPLGAIHFGTSKYTIAAQAARATLTGAPNNWAITDGGQKLTAPAPGARVSRDADTVPMRLQHTDLLGVGDIIVYEDGSVMCNGAPMPDAVVHENADGDIDGISLTDPAVWDVDLRPSLETANAAN